MDPETVQWVYLGVLIVGFGYAVISGALSALFGGGGHGADGGLDGHGLDGAGHGLDGAHGGALGGTEISTVADTVQFSPLSPAVISMFLTCFGGVGFAATHAGWPQHQVVLAAAGSGFVVGGIMWWLFDHVFRATQGGSQPGQQEVVGLKAEVITPIPAHGVGEIAYEARGTRFTAAARTEDGAAAARGALLVIARVSGGTCYVAGEPAAEPRV